MTSSSWGYLNVFLRERGKHEKVLSMSKTQLGLFDNISNNITLKSGE